MIENNCSCSVLSNKIDKSIIRRYDNNKGRKRSGLDKSKLQAVEKAKESLAVQGFLPVRRAPLVRALASHARGRRFESASLHQTIRTLWINERKAQGFQGVRDFLRPKIFKVFDGSMKTRQRFEQGLNLCFSIFKQNFSGSALF